MTTKAAEMQYDMGIVDKFSFGDRRQIIAKAEIWDNGYIGYGYTGRWRRQKRRRCGTGYRSNGYREEH